MAVLFLLLPLAPLLWLLAVKLRVVVMVVLVVVAVLQGLVELRVRLLLALGFGLRLGVGLGLGDRLEAVKEVVLEERGDRLRTGMVCSLLLGCLDRPRGGRGAAGSLLCGCRFCLGRGLVDEGGGEGQGGGGG